MPDIEVDREGNIKAQGKEVTRIKVNGKDFFGGDVKTATRDLPRDIVDKIQIIDDYGDQANASGIKEGEPDKVINIQLKKDKNVGYFGSSNVGIGTKDIYQVAISGNYFNKDKQVSIIANADNNNSGSLGGQNVTQMMGNGMGGMMRSIVKSGGAGGGNNGGGNSNAGRSNGDFGFTNPNGFGNNTGINTNKLIGFNYRDDLGKSATIYGSYVYSSRRNNTNRATNTQRFFNGATVLNEANSLSENTTNSHRFFLNSEIKLDSFNYIKINPNFVVSKNFSKSSSITDVFNSNIKSSNINSKNNITALTPAYSGSFLYNKKFRKRGRNLSLNFNYNFNDNETDQISTNVNDIFLPVVNNINLLQNINTDNNRKVMNLSASFSEPISKDAFIDFTATSNINNSINNRETFIYDAASNTYIKNQALSDNFNNDFNYQRYGVSYRKVAKKYNFTLGMNVQPTSLEGTSVTRNIIYKKITNLNFLPQLQYAYNFSRSKTFRFGYNPSVNQPSITQLQAIPDVTNLQSQTVGNPNLRTEQNHKINLGYNKFNLTGSSLFANLSFTTTNNKIVNNSINKLNNPNASIGSAAQLNIPQNVNGYYNVNVFGNYSIPFQKRKYVLSSNTMINYSNNIILSDSVKGVNKNTLITQGLNFEFNCNLVLTLGVGVNYSLNKATYKFPTNFNNLFKNTNFNNYSITHNIDYTFKKFFILKYDINYYINNGLATSIKNNYTLFNASIEKQMFKKKNGTLRFSAFDIFNQNTNITRSVTTNSIVDARTNTVNQYFMLTAILKAQKFKGKMPQNTEGVNRQGNGEARRLQMNF